VLIFIIAANRRKEGRKNISGIGKEKVRGYVKRKLWEI
jgi:hypothetical protein